jgi:hypothetical protein
MSVRQVMGEKGAVDDVNKARAELARPDGYVEVTPGMKFEVLDTGDMGAAQFDLLQEAKSEIDAVGVNAALSGNEERVMSGRALIARSEQGMAELGPAFDSFKQFQHAVYRKVWNRIRQFWTAEKWIRVTDDEKNVKFVGLNQPLTLKEQLLEQIGEEGLVELSQQPGFNPEQLSQVVGVKNHIAELDVDIIIDDTPSSASLQGEQFESLVQLAPQAATMPPPLFKALIQASSLRNKDKIIESLEGKDDVPPQVQQMQAQMQEMGQALKEAQIKAQEADFALREKDLLLQQADLKRRALELSNDPQQQGAMADLQRQAMEVKHARDLLAKDTEIALLKLKAGAMSAQHASEKAQAATEAANEPAKAD